MSELAPGKEARQIVVGARTLRAEAADVLAAPATRRADARREFDSVRDAIAHEQLATMPVAKLREVTEGRLVLGPLEAAGFRTVDAVYRAGQHRLEQVPRVGPQTAAQIAAAARHLEQAIAQAVRVRFDADRRPADQTRLLATLRAYELAETAAAPLRDGLDQLDADLDRLIDDSHRASGRLRLFFSSRRAKAVARSALSELDDIIRAPATRELQLGLTEAHRNLAEATPEEAAIWADYEARAVSYNGLLIEIGELSTDQDATQGFIPSEIAEKVRGQPLDTSLLNVSLRGYQAFGAKFAIVQRKAIIGDEMGLGKTIEAIAMMCHLRSQGATHFLVVCPASVLVNWAHEVRRHSELSPYRLHGPDSLNNRALWERRGGVAITTYGSLRSLTRPERAVVSLLVVDEAHYVRNPAAQRTIAVRNWITQAERSLFLTGTPMENRVAEFQSLVRHLQPAIADQVRPVDGLTGADNFRKTVASIYLRRNQSDVLSELPPLIRIDEWVELSSSDHHAYRTAVAEGNFMAMRRAAYASRTAVSSAKLARLVEIVEESASNGRKVVIFSFFREVLETVRGALDGLAIGPLTGSVPPSARQQFVDQFSAHQGPRVLVSQIEAGGVGLNIQAASVVILTEPQWKPTTEDQAIARCHRLGQVRPVDVHRLLAEDTVDERMLEVLAQKAALFDEYVRQSELKDASPDAVDIADMKIARQLASQAEAERRIVELERKRLGLRPVE